MLYPLEFLMNATIIVFTLAKLNQSTKYMLKVAKEILAKGKSSKFNFTYKVKPSLVFDFLAGRKHTCSERNPRLPAQN